MKNKKKDVFGRTYTKSGYIRHIVLTVLGVISFALVVLLTGSKGTDLITTKEYIMWLGPSLAVFGASVLLHNKIFN